MWEDPIVKEVREAGDEIAKEYNYNLHELMEALRKKEKERGNKVVSLENKNKKNIA